MPDEILKEIFADHLPYEIDMLRFTFNKLAQGGLAKEENNTYLEAFAVHARSLMDFFQNRQSKADDVVAGDFTSTFVPKINDKVKPLSGIRTKLNKQVFHLTKD